MYLLVHTVLVALLAVLAIYFFFDDETQRNTFCYPNTFDLSGDFRPAERVSLTEATSEFVTVRMHWGRPFVVSGVTGKWPANQKWNHGYFESIFSGCKLFSSTFATDAYPDFSASASVHEVYYGIFLNNRNLAELVSADYTYPSFIPKQWRVTGNEWIHWGYPPCGAKRHMDLMCTSRISVQVRGVKQWRLYPITSPTNNWTQVLHPLHITLHPGEALVWFPGWEHETSITEGPSISLSLHFLSPQDSVYQNTFSEELSRAVSQDCDWK